MIGKSPGSFECTALLGKADVGINKIDIFLHWREELEEPVPAE